MNLTASIQAAELKFRQSLEDFFVRYYDEKDLLSHGIDHHRRVWHYAREILGILYDGRGLSPFPDPTHLIIACYLHDIGMAADPGPRHGKLGREICIAFLQEHSLDPGLYQDLLEAIELHDRKDYSQAPSGTDILTVLAVADDLDAFGYMGIYRYSEIYLARGIRPEIMGTMILENAVARFDNFERLFREHAEYVGKQRERFSILSDFFVHYNRQSASYNFDADIPQGYCGLISLFSLIVARKTSFGDLLGGTTGPWNDPIIELYLKGLRSEQFQFLR